MSLRHRYLQILAGIVPIGVVGVSLLLGSTAPAAASQDPPQAQPLAAREGRVSERLAAIREAVSDVVEPDGAAITEPRRHLAWWAWRNGGGGWRNGGGGWRNGGGGWRNGGAWGNGGWRNGGWSNFWRNW